MRFNIKEKVRKHLMDLYETLESKKYEPKKNCDLRAVSFSSYIPKDNKLLCQCTEWDNGEGYDFSLTWTKGTDKMTSLSNEEIEIMIYCLTDLGYFYDKNKE